MQLKNIKINKLDKRKYLSLTVTIILTIFIFTMSLLSGTESSEISSSLSVSIKGLIDFLFINNNISLEILHKFVRKGAHVFEYFVLGISYFFTARNWKLSILRVLLLGLVTATIDELLQNIPADRAASALDIFIFDFGGFILGFGLFLILINRQKKIEISKALSLLENKEISTQKAYKYIYQNKDRIYFTNNAHFIKLKVIIPGEKGVNKLLRVLFFLPIPLFIFKIAISFINLDKTDVPFSKSELMKLVNSKDISIVVNTSTKEKIIIKTI